MRSGLRIFRRRCSLAKNRERVTSICLRGAFLYTQHASRQVHGEPFNYQRVRDLLSRAVTETNNLHASSDRISAIIPYGFELLASLRPNMYWPHWPRRHFPAIGYSKKVSRAKAQRIAWVFLSIFARLISDEYPSFYDRLGVMELHKNGQYWKFNPRKTKKLLSEEYANTLQVELFPLHPGQTILEHYANYVACLFGAIFAGNKNLPEVRDFASSRTRRFRLFQEFVMCESLARKFMPDLVALNEYQEALWHELFNVLRDIDVYESVFPAERPREITFEELRIRDELVFMRMAQIRTELFRGEGEDVRLVSPAYYDGGHQISAVMKVPLSCKIRAEIEQSYEEFPEVVMHHYGGEFKTRCGSMT